MGVVLSTAPFCSPLHCDNICWVMINYSHFVGKEVSEMLVYARPIKAILDHVDTENKDDVPI